MSEPIDPADPDGPHAGTPEPFAMHPPAFVKKRGGALVPFDIERVREAVRRAQAAVGEPDPPLADEVASLVMLTLASRAGGGQPPPPEIEQLQDLVEEALIGLGRSAVAKAYILYRDRRGRARSTLSVHDGRPAPVGDRGPLVRGDDGPKAWNPSRITAALVEEADVPREVAEEVANRVERRVLHAGLPRVSTALIREFVDNELAAMGLSTQLQRQQPVTMARADLRAGLNRPRGSRASEGWIAANSSEGIADRLLRRWCLEDVLPREVTELHLDGTLHIEDVGRPHLPLVRCLPVELLSGGSARARVDTLERLAEFLAQTGHGIVLEGVHGMLPPALRPSRAADALAEILATLGVLGRAAGRRLDLAAPGGRGGGLVARLLPELAQLEAEGRPLPRLFLAWEEVQAAIAADSACIDPLEALLARGRVVPVWHGRAERWVGPGCRRRQREKGALACGAAAAINLPRLARRAGPWREDLFFEELTRAVRGALDGLDALGNLQRDTSSHGSDGWRERVQHALVPIGLTETLRILGDGAPRMAQGARVLGVLSEATRRFSAERGSAVVVSSLLGEGARRRMAELDSQGPRTAQARLFDDLPAPESEITLRYGAGFPLGEAPTGGDVSEGARVRGEAWATLCATVASGALFPLAGPDAVAVPGSHPHLETWRAFHAARERSRAGVVTPAPRDRTLSAPDDAALFGSPSSTSRGEPAFPRVDPSLSFPVVGSPTLGFPTTGYSDYEDPGPESSGSGFSDHDSPRSGSTGRRDTPYDLPGSDT